MKRSRPTSASRVPIPLPAIAATLRDRDGSEALSIDIAGIPDGATLSDGEHHFTATSLEQRLAISDWDLGKLSITPPPDTPGRFTLTIIATATERSNGNQASTTAGIEVLVLPVGDAWTRTAPVSFEMQADDGKGNRIEQRFTVPFGTALRTGTSGKPAALPGPAGVAANSSRANGPLKPGPQARIDWGGAQPACFAGPRLAHSPWLPSSSASRTASRARTVPPCRSGSRHEVARDTRCCAMAVIVHTPYAAAGMAGSAGSSKPLRAARTEPR